MPHYRVVVDRKVRVIVIVLCRCRLLRQYVLVHVGRKGDPSSRRLASRATVRRDGDGIVYLEPSLPRRLFLRPCRWSTPGRSGVPMRPLLLELNFYCGEAECYFGDLDLKYCV